MIATTTRVQAGPWVDAGGSRRRRWYDGDDLAASVGADGRWVAFGPDVGDEAAETVIGEGPTGGEDAADACLRAAGYLDDAGASPDPTAAEVLAAMRAQAGADLVAALAKAHAAVDRLTRDMRVAAAAAVGLVSERDEARAEVAHLREVLGVMRETLRSRADTDPSPSAVAAEATIATWREAHAALAQAFAGVTRSE